MSTEFPRGSGSAKWPFAYLSVTALSIALVVGIEYGQTEFGPTLDSPSADSSSACTP